MTEITVEPGPGGSYDVTVADTGSSTTHNVTVSETDVGRFAGGRSP